MISKITNNVDEKKTHETFINDTWIFWFHEKDSINNNWRIDGYIELNCIKSVEDFWILYNNINVVSENMFYLMRKDYPPIWDHPKNINGGAWTFKIDFKFLEAFWIELSSQCIGETICDNSETIVGISVSPKVGCATVRVWTKNTN